jgi:hypothetical protein
MLRMIGLAAVAAGWVGGASAKPPMAAPLAKELAPMERDHYMPPPADGLPEYVPMLPKGRSQADDAAMPLLKFDRDLLPKLTLPLGLARLPTWATH